MNANTCPFYFVHLDQNFYPIPDTMFASNLAASNVCTTLIAPVSPTQTVAPKGEQQCIPSSGYRYWYQVTWIPDGKGGSTSRIVPNSMIKVVGLPNANGGRQCTYLEWQKYAPIGS